MQAFSLGAGTIAQGANQVVIGEYNIAKGTYNSRSSGDRCFIIGNGASDLTRHNALEVQWDGGVLLSMSTASSAGTTDKALYQALQDLGWTSILTSD